MTAGTVVFVLPNTMGGMLNIVASLIEHRSTDGMPCHVVFTDNANVPDTRFRGTIPGATTQHVVRHCLPTENLYAVLRRLRGAIPTGPGVLVCNDLLELALLHVWDPGRMVVQILHGDHDYYYDLAARHEGVIDVFITYSQAMHRTLQQRLPHRAADVLYLPYGVTLPSRHRVASAGPLRVVFAGRLEHGQKGVLDLPAIDAEIRRRGVTVEWTIIGGGPDEQRLREQWRGAHVQWRGTLAREALLDTLSNFDVFVLPTRAEGFPVALVEAMGAGLVPVVSDIPSGVPELVSEDEGIRPSVGDIDGFASALIALDSDRARLDRMSCAARRRVEAFDPAQRTGAYEAVFAQWASRTRVRAHRTAVPYGSRLDQPWIPNPVVRAVRRSIRHWQGKR